MAQAYQSIVVLTGAGVSAESGIRTFRDAGGLWENHRLEDVCTPEAFENNPELVHRFYNARRAQLTQVKPNPAHLALAAFEQSFDGQFTLVSQNVDDLHERAGSHNLLHMHGQLCSLRCNACGDSRFCTGDSDTNSECPSCKTFGSLRPDIVWFGEVPMFMPEIEQALSNCDLFISIGTSGNVYPAAGFVALARACGAHTVEINLEPSAGQSQFAEHHYGPASETVPAYLERIIDGKFGTPV